MLRHPPRFVFLVPLLAAVAACGGRPETGAAAGTEGAYAAPRTAWGDPDLQGMWPIDKLNGTPVQRPPELGDRRYLTDEEYAARVERLRGLNARYDASCDQSSGLRSVYSPSTVPSTASSSTRPRMLGGSSAL